MTHLVLGDANAHALREAGFGPITVLRDLVSVGRSHADPAKHRAARIAQWRIDDSSAVDGVLDRDALAVALSLVDGPIVLWTSPTWPSRLYEWATIDWLAATGFDLARVERVDTRFKIALLPAAFETRAPVDRERVRCARELWSAFLEPTPLLFDALRLRGSSAYPDLLPTCEGFGACFPQLVEGRLRFSYFDDLLLDGIKPTWPERSGVSFFRGPRAKEVDKIMSWFGDVTLFERLKALYRNGTLDHREFLTKHNFPIPLYRLTPLGLRLRDEGTTDIADLAPLDLGGFRINDPSEPWVRENIDGGWRLRAL